MLFLLFELGTARYALDVRQIAEVLPLVAMTHIPQAPPEVSGLFNYRGSPVPVVDVSQLTLGRPSARRLSTRIVLVHYPDRDGITHVLGLIVEKATTTVHYAPQAFVPSGLTVPEAPYLGPIATDAAGLLQRIDVSTLLPPALRELLFSAPLDERWALPTSKNS